MRHPLLVRHSWFEGVWPGAVRTLARTRRRTRFETGAPTGKTAGQSVIVTVSVHGLQPNLGYGILRSNSRSIPTLKLWLLPQPLLHDPEGVLGETSGKLVQTPVLSP